MAQLRIWLFIAGLGLLSACAGTSYKGGLDAANPAPFGREDVGATAGSRERTPSSRLVVPAKTALATDKLIALTFDDGPRPYVLFGTGGIHSAPGLLDVLDQNGIKATFFVVGWRLTPKTWGEPRHEENIGVTCIDAAEQLNRRGYELEDHTYSHVQLRSAEKKNGERWVVDDVDRGARAIKAVTGLQPRYLRPPDWIITEDARRDLEHEGYRVLTISPENPLALRDVNSLDYLCAGKAVGCPKPSMVDAVLKQVEQREKKGVYTHILAFHELSSTAVVMPRLITELRARGYRFVTLSDYMRLVAAGPGEVAKKQMKPARSVRLASLRR